MGLKQWIARLRGDEGLFKVAEKIAAQCLDASWNKIKPRAAQMPIAELRGYVRARTRLAVKNAIGRSEEAAALPLDSPSHEFLQRRNRSLFCGKQPSAALTLRMGVGFGVT